MAFTHGSLFSGIGGFDLAAEWMGWENKFHCEWNLFGQSVLNHYWPDAKSYSDITKTDFSIWRGRVDILTGGFPCQPYSTAGKRLGKEDERHLWPHMLRAIREIKPRWVVGENVSGLISWNGGMVFDEVQADLEAEGYEVIPFVLPAAGVNAPHRRDRVWFVAYSKNNGQSGQSCGSDDRRAGRILAGGRINERGESFGCDTGGTDSETLVVGVRSSPDNKGECYGLRAVQREDEEIPERDNNAEPGDTNTRTAAHTGGERSGDNSREISDKGRATGENRGEGLRQGNGETGTGGIDAASSNDRPSQNTYQNGRGGDQWEEEPGIRKQRNTGAGDNERVSADHGETRANPNTGGRGLQTVNSVREPEGEEQSSRLHGQIILDTNPGHERLQRRELNGTPDEEGQVGWQQPSRSTSELHQITDWEIWPTVSPLCSGDDGFSDILDADALPKDKSGKSPRNTYNKWRNESIKAGGNAIVPEVALQIFKAIKIMEDMINA